MNYPVAISQEDLEKKKVNRLFQDVISHVLYFAGLKYANEASPLESFSNLLSQFFLIERDTTNS